MNLEGGYGVFIYTLIPISFLLVLGGHRHLRGSEDDFVNFAQRCSAAGARRSTGSSRSC